MSRIPFVRWPTECKSQRKVVRESRFGTRGTLQITPEKYLTIASPLHVQRANFVTPALLLRRAAARQFLRLRRVLLKLS